MTPSRTGGVAIKWRRKSGHIAGGLFGILFFLLGAALLIMTFRMAFELFGRDPGQLLDLQKGKPLDLNNAGAQLIGVVVKIILLLVMAIVGGMIANRGIRLYADSKPQKHPDKVTAPVAEEKKG